MDSGSAIVAKVRNDRGDSFFSGTKTKTLKKVKNQNSKGQAAYKP